MKKKNQRDRCCCQKWVTMDGVMRRDRILWKIVIVSLPAIVNEFVIPSRCKQRESVASRHLTRIIRIYIL